jgi:glycine hydroxymethyltransferase
MLLCRAEHAAAIDRAVFPGLQGGPHNHTTAAIAVALHEAAHPSFRDYAHAVVANARTLADRLLSHGFTLVSGGTDNHLILIDLNNKGVSGKIAAAALERAGIVCNANSVPFDPRKPFDPSGIRIGTPAITTRGMGAPEMNRLGDWIAAVVAAPDDVERQTRIAAEVTDLCAGFPAPGV